MRAVTLLLWAILLVAGVALEILGRRRLGELVPLDRALQRLRSVAIGRAALVLAWMWLGWHLFAR